MIVCFSLVRWQNVIIYTPESAQQQSQDSLHDIVYETIALRTQVPWSIPGRDTRLRTMDRSEAILAQDIFALALANPRNVTTFLAEVKEIQQILRAQIQDIQYEQSNATLSYESCVTRKADADESYVRALSLRNSAAIQTSVSAAQDAAACMAEYRVQLNSIAPVLGTLQSYLEIAETIYETIFVAKDVLMTSPELLQDNILEQLISIRTRLRNL